MFLYNPTDDYSVDEECMKNNDTVYSYLIKKHNSILDIYNIEDPFWKSEKKSFDNFDDDYEIDEFKKRFW